MQEFSVLLLQLRSLRLFKKIFFKQIKSMVQEVRRVVSHGGVRVTGRGCRIFCNTVMVCFLIWGVTTQTHSFYENSSICTLMYFFLCILYFNKKVLKNIFLKYNI